METRYARTNLDKLVSVIPITTICVAIIYYSHQLGYGDNAIPLIEQSGHSILTNAGFYAVLTLSQWISSEQEISPSLKALIAGIVTVVLECIPFPNTVFSSKDVLMALMTSLILYPLDESLLRLTKPIVAEIEKRYRENH